LGQLPEGIQRAPSPANFDAQQGVNSWPGDNVGYRGPMPPPGSGRHRYFFRVYALDKLLTLPPDKATKDAALKAAQGHILGQGELMGTYERK
jgi:phosphatidylethanolamine-binding protein (PEBP) family uncharacterized protein